MTNENKPRAEPSSPPEARICTVCQRRYANPTTHVTTDAHLLAMADESVREWLALPANDPNAIAFAKQIARLEALYDSYDDWCRAMGLPDTTETLVVFRRISAIWIKAIGTPDYARRMSYPRALIDIELGKVPLEQGGSSR